MYILYCSQSRTKPVFPCFQSTAGAREMGEHSHPAADQADQHPEHPHQPGLQVPGRVHGMGGPEVGKSLQPPNGPSRTTN